MGEDVLVDVAVVLEAEGEPVVVVAVVAVQ
jgi:hypothetical protein